VIRVYDGAGNVIETLEHKGEFKEWSARPQAAPSGAAVIELPDPH
jgi:hypothetical protein